VKTDCDDTDPDVWPGAEGWSEDCRRVPGFASDHPYGTRGGMRGAATGVGCTTTPGHPWPMAFLLALAALLFRRR
jgi:MYXO-CTERM domain-containing protein